MKKFTAVNFASLVASSAYAGTAYFKYDQISGMNKICYYDHLGSTVAITIGATSLCPMTISV
jgi:hypothetical protein